MKFRVFEWDSITISPVEILRVDDIKLDWIPFLEDPCKYTVESYINESNLWYPIYCEEMSQKYKEYTFKSFDDVLNYVAENKENITPITVRKMDCGYTIVCNGKHRWCAAYLLNLKTIPCVFQDEKIIVSTINNRSRMPNFRIEWKDEANPDREWVLKVKDIKFDILNNSNDKKEIWRCMMGDKDYAGKCSSKRADPERFPGFTFTCFDDVYKYVEKSRENTDPITVEERLDGSYAINHGKHRLAAAKLLDVETLRCKIRKYIPL